MPAAAETKKIPERDRSGIRDLSTGQEIKLSGWHLHFGRFHRFYDAGSNLVRVAI